MPKARPSGHFTKPLNAILGSQSKVSILRALCGSSVPLSCQDLARRSGMAYRAINLALADLVSAGILVPAGGTHQRLYRIHAEHRLSPALCALLRAERDIPLALRSELTAGTVGGPPGLLGAAVVGPGAVGEEQIGDRLTLVCVVADRAAVRAWTHRFVAVSSGVSERYGVQVQVTVYDLTTARSMWATRTRAAHDAVVVADAIAGQPLLDLIQERDG